MVIDRELLSSLAVGFGVELDEQKLDLLDAYAEMMLHTNESMNLTAIKDARGVTVKHFADSISLLGAVNPPQGAKVIDIGTGAGFPGIPLLICRPDLDLTLLDSTRKKLDFIDESAAKLNLPVKTLHLRAEEAGKSALHREKYDLVVSRAVASLEVLSEYCLPLVKIGGVFAAMKGANWQMEAQQAQSAIKLLGGEKLHEKSFSLADDGERCIIVIKKISQTLPKYPRASTIISKKPL